MKLTRTAAALSTLTMLAVGCSNTPADLHGLPENDAERATLCSRAAVAYAAAAETSKLPEAEQKRRAQLLQTVVDETDFFGANDFEEAEGQEIIGDIESTLTGGDWLSTLNNCKAAYELGDAEPTPTLSDDPAEKAAACGAAVLIANLDGRSMDSIKTMLQDEQSSYFLTMAAANSGGDLDKASTALETQIPNVINSGAVPTYKEQCLAEFPKAKLGRDVTLPKADDAALVACVYASEIVEPVGKEEKERGEAMQAKLDKHPANMITPARSKELQAGLYQSATDLGAPSDILTACEKRFQ